MTAFRARLRRLTDSAVAHADRTIALTGAILLAAHLVAAVVLAKPNGRVVFGDATHHFVQLRSLVFDRDLNFQNEYTRIYELRGGEPETEWVTRDLTSTGHVRNYMPIGPALLWAPLYLLIVAAQWLASIAGLAAAPDGYGRVAQLAPGLTGIMAATCAAMLAHRFARRLTDPSTALAATLAVWLGSHALYYSLVSPSYSHAPSMLAGAIFFGHWLATRDAPSPGRLAVSGALAGLAALMRWQDALFLLVPLIEALRWRTTLTQRLTGAVAGAMAFVVVFSPQMIVWNVLYGHPFTIPQGPSFMQWTTPHLWLVLVSVRHGLFSWAPLLIPAAIGLVAWCLRDRRAAAPVLLVLAASWYVNAAVADWWAGEAFGARRFLSLFPLFVAGLAWWLAAGTVDRRPRVARLAIVALLVVANGLLLLQYELAMKGLDALAPYPGDAATLWLTRFVVPFRVAAWLMR